jgi:hypothetical protein
MVTRLVFKRQPEHLTHAVLPESADRDGGTTVPLADVSDLVSVASDVTGEP